MSDDPYEENSLSDLSLWADKSAREILEQVCEDHGVPVDVISELVSLQRERQHQERAKGIYGRFEEILGRID